MNKRLKLLAHQAWVDNDNMDAGGYTDLEKFAELIVRECANVADRAEENSCEWIGGNILIHFGIKS